MISNNPVNRAASGAAPQTGGPTAADGSPLSRSAMVDTDQGNAQHIDTDAFLTANIPQIDNENIVKDGVYLGVGADVTAEKGQRGLTSSHISAMQDEALTGNFYLPAEGGKKPVTVDGGEDEDGEDEEDKEDAEDEDRGTAAVLQKRNDSAAARRATIEDDSEGSDENEDEAGDVATPIRTKANTNPPKQAARRVYTESRGERFNTAWVDEHPDEDYTHKGKGWWARGLPQPGDNAKSGVRGPGAAAWKAVNTGKK
ncbi:hypothetical protein CLAFUR0_04640 [Fulvia fulva]|nr:hypothetical protein CLAFUR0_04640 [Fulvia fulva]